MQRLHDARFDIMLEAKAKDLALLKLRKDLASLGMAEVLLNGRNNGGNNGGIRSPE